MKRHHVQITLEQPGTDDLVEYVVRTDNRDLVRWDLLRSRKGWPSATDAPFLFSTVTAWSALRRAGDIGDESIDAFIDRCLGAIPVNEDGTPITKQQIDEGDGAPDVDPSQPEVASGY